MFNKNAFLEWIIKHNYTNLRVAHLIGCSESMVDYLRRGVKQPSLGLFINIKKATGLTYEELIVEV